ncbi:MAG: ATPase [Hyphomicrobiales bacterium]|nr:ATPase [Hyphomicrobiales bacterium]
MRDIFNNPDHDGLVNPQTAAQKAMRPQLPKRFYKEVTILEEPEDEDAALVGAMQFAIHLDGRKIKTPARNALLFPNIKSARIVAEEWEAQKDTIDAATMPANRLVNTAIDGIAIDAQAVVEDMLKFASSDLLCYRASSSPGLIELQKENWDPVLDWIADEYGASFETTRSLIQIDQPKESVTLISVALRRWQDPITIAALHTFTVLTGSVILALAIAAGEYTAAQAWQIAHVDEDWNINTWGEDHEAKKRRDNRWKEMEAAYFLFCAVNDQA